MTGWLTGRTLWLTRGWTEAQPMTLCPRLTGKEGTRTQPLMVDQRLDRGSASDIVSEAHRYRRNKGSVSLG